ncbi:MAG: large conductance mechanosensitive channel protein MscL [Alphaproteobacteria bacterium]|nr:large conductance mechanosensitive channel protein MscL [Alphaproteobacteria bacterium]
MLSEFEKFAVRGNVMDMAIGIIIGSAFGKIVNSLVSDVLMPPLGLLMGKVDFANIFLTLHDGKKIPGPYDTLEMAQKAGAVTLNLGVFLNSVITFVIVAFAVFMLVKAMNTLRSRFDANKAVGPTQKNCPYCCSKVDIRARKCPFCTSALKPGK